MDREFNARPHLNFALSLCITLLIGGMGCAQMQKNQDSKSIKNTSELRNPKLFISRALAVRTEGVIEPHMISDLIMEMPATEINKDRDYPKHAPKIWSIFFRNSILRVGNLASATPVALYYNPLMDVAVISFWESRNNRRYELKSIQALPGEHLADKSSGPVELKPLWLQGIEQKSPFSLIRETTLKRLEDFKRMYPVNGATASPVELPLSRERQTVAELRLLHQAKMLSDRDTMVDATINEFKTSLVRGKTPSTMKYVSKNNKALTKTLTGLNPTIAKQLEIDGIYSFGNHHRIVFLSLPQDGSLYLTALFSSEKSNKFKLTQVGGIDLQEGMHP